MLRCQWRSLGGAGTKAIVPWSWGFNCGGALVFYVGFGTSKSRESRVAQTDNGRQTRRLADSRRPTRLTDLVNCIVFQLKFVLIEQTARQSRQILPSLAWRDP